MPFGYFKKDNKSLDHPSRMKGIILQTIWTGWLEIKVNVRLPKTNPDHVAKK